MSASRPSLDVVITHLLRITGDSPAGRFANEVVRHLRRLRTQSMLLAQQKLDLEWDLREARQEAAEAKRAAARRLGEIECLLEANRRCKEKLKGRGR